VKIRYKDSGAAAIVNPTGNSSAQVIFESPVKSITPGQSAVFYEGEDVVAGGWIDR
jgi:tRNA-specific 2-thiouridylase